MFDDIDWIAKMSRSVILGWA